MEAQGQAEKKCKEESFFHGCKLTNWAKIREAQNYWVFLWKDIDHGI
jgi:hypothetical protein